MATATSWTSTKERRGIVTFKGNPLTLIGPAISVGQQAPEFQVLTQDLAPVTLGSSKGSVRLISVVPSLDTPICDAQTRRFNEEAARFPEAVAVMTISMDLPFAQKRWCGSAGVNRIQVLSDHRDASFGTAYGTLIKELRLLARSVFVIDERDSVQYVEYVSEVTTPPHYDAALAAVRSLIQTQ